MPNRDEASQTREWRGDDAEPCVAGDMAQRLLGHGIYVIGFSYPVVPKGQARIRVQLSAAHSDEDIDRAITAFTSVGRELGVAKPKGE